MSSGPLRNMLNNRNTPYLENSENCFLDYVFRYISEIPRIYESLIVLLEYFCCIFEFYHLFGALRRLITLSNHYRTSLVSRKRYIPSIFRKFIPVGCDKVIHSHQFFVRKFL